MLNRYLLKLTFLPIFVIALCSTPIKAQNVCIQILSESEQPLPLSLMLSASNNTSFVTDEQGKACLPVGDYMISQLGYESKTVTITENSTNINLYPDIIVLGKVMVNEQTYGQPLIEEEASISILPIQQLEAPNIPNYAALLNSIPGVYMHSGSINTNRMTIRGIGSRSQFDTEKVRAYLSNIPLTNGSGQTTIEDLDLNLLGSIEIIKGPSSSQYGNSLAGTLLIQPQKIQDDAPTVSLNYGLGSFGYQQAGLKFEKEINDHDLIIAGQGLSAEGYRENNQVDRRSILLSHRYSGNKFYWYNVGYFIDQKAQIPSSISGAARAEDRRQAAFTWGSAQGYEDYQKLLLGSSLSIVFSPTSSLHTSVFGTYFDNYEPRPFNILAESTTGFGTRNRWILETPKITWIIGQEFFLDLHDFQTFSNLYRDNNGAGSLRGSKLTDLSENRSYFNTFSQLSYHLSARWEVKAGINLNNTSYTLSDNNPSSTVDQSGSYQYDWILSPSVSVTFKPNDNTRYYTSLNHGFSPPTLEETLTPDGQINAQIQPETGWQLEVGHRRFGSWGYLSGNLYSIWVRDLLISRRTAEDQFIGINAGKTIHQGLEVESSLKLYQSERLSITQNSSGSIGRFRFVEFVEEDQVFDGNRLPGLPEWTLHNAWTFNLDQWAFTLSYQGTGSMYLDDNNTIKESDYHLLGSSLSKKFRVGPVVSLISFSANNLLNVDYNSMLLVNAVGFGGSEPRYYYPALPRNFLLSIKIGI